MKSYLKVILPLVAIVASIYLFKPVKTSLCLSDLLLQNVEALANNERPVNTDCLGIGSVDCPLNSTKVKRVVESW